LTKDSIVTSVPYFPERRVYLPTSENDLKTRLNLYIINDFKTQGVNFFEGYPESDYDYYIDIQYALGCPSLGQTQDCRILIIWEMFRGDNSPVTGWRAFYPISIPVDYHLSRFKNFKVPDTLIKLIGDDFIKSLNYETLKKETEDKVYIEPDKLTDGTSLCSSDFIAKHYSNAGLFSTDKAYKARFYISTQILLSPDFNQTKDIIIKRIILDRITGDFQTIPFKAIFNHHEINPQTYNCIETANSTIKIIGEFIANAP
jgi:hypothetical protein